MRKASQRNSEQAGRLTAAVRLMLWPRHFAACGLALCLAIVSGAHSLAQATDRSVLALGPIGQHANGLLAAVDNNLRLGSNIRNPDEIIAAARKALALSPLNASAASLIGLALDQKGDTDGARKSMNVAIQITRRDPTAQLWLGQESILKGKNLVPILHRFDMVMRSQPVARSAIFAALSDTLVNAEMREALQPYVRTDNIWFEGFAFKAAETPVSAVGLAKILMLLTKPLPDTPSLRNAYAATIRQVAAERQFEIMNRLYRRVPGAQKGELQSAALPRGNTMEYPPATWLFVNDPAVGSSMTDVSADPQLELYAANEIGGIAAQKMLLLPPGNYQLRWRLDENSDNPGSQIRTLILCDDMSGERVIAENVIDARSFVNGQDIGASRTIRMDFSVATAGCRALRLEIRTRGGKSRDESRWLLSKLFIAPMGESRSIAKAS